MRGRLAAGILALALLGPAVPAFAPALPLPADPVAARPRPGPEAVRALLAPHLPPADLDRALADRAAVSRVAALLRRLEAPGSRDLAVEVEVEPGPGGGRVVYVSLRRRGSLERSDTDRYWHAPSAVTLDETALVLAPPRPPRRSAGTPPAPAPPAPDALPAGEAPCAAADQACWRHRTLADLEARPPACEPYLQEQEAHLRRLATDPDPNGTAAPPDPDPRRPEAQRAERMREVAGAYPSGAIEAPGHLALADRVTVTNRPPASAPTPSEPSGECTATMAPDALAAVPGLACTREAMHWRAWRRDPLAAADRATLGLLRSLPLVDMVLSRRARAIADDRSPAGLWAALWIERWEAARARGDTAWQDRAAAALRQSPEERAALAERLRRWLSTPAQAPWHGAIRAVYEERFTALYPQAAGPDGMPDLARFPTRLWWASNWLAEAARRGWTPEAAADRLRCGPDGDRAAAVLRDLQAPLGRDPRFGALLSGMLARL